MYIEAVMVVVVVMKLMFTVGGDDGGREGDGVVGVDVVGDWSRCG